MLDKISAGLPADAPRARLQPALSVSEIRERSGKSHRRSRISLRSIRATVRPSIMPWPVHTRWTRPRREQTPRWVEASCNENNQHVVIGKDNYYASADG